MLPALIHDLNAARNDTRNALRTVPDAVRDGAMRILVEEDRNATNLILRNCELLGLR